MTERNIATQKLDPELKLEILAALMETSEEDDFLPVKKQEVKAEEPKENEARTLT